MSKFPFGATPLLDGGVHFRVWAPNVQTLAVKIKERQVSMTKDGEDFEVFVADAQPGDLYSLVVNGANERPDPVSRSQPRGVHGPSQIVDPYAFAWSDSEWKGIALENYIIYELHAGTFTPDGTFAGVIAKLPHLKALGITAIELMPVAEFPGSRNWGYDGVDLYAPHSAYGGPEGLKTLVNAAHREGLAVVLDVVYNHLGPEGNYLGEFGPYFTDHYRTPWGQAINFDGPGSDGVRRFFIENALYWLTEFHIDALRLDAIHGIFDFSAQHILAELGERFHAQAERLGRQAWIIAESDLNDVRVIQSRSEGGYGLDAQWHDEFHHSVVSFLTRANRGFLGGFGRLDQVKKAITEGFVYDGIYSTYRCRRFGSSAIGQPGYRFVAFLQNHDQVANTSQGLRLSRLMPLDQLKAALALLFCSPYLPLLFMGEEFADDAPFLYFTSHGDPALAKAVSEGRKKEFADFAGTGEFVDPQSPEAFEKSKVTWSLALQPSHADVLHLYRELIALRKRWPCLSNGRKDLTQVEVNEDERWLRMERSDPDGSSAVLVCNFGEKQAIGGPDLNEDWQVALRTPAAVLYLKTG
ncbi:MAG TPA: malto-oligosyltrehalose trehalohydrolase [Bryobacteraceae bacterium]|nr:malto-oligosyltrehalose trehalohydrolase [Bryobacteraceae bacterium]